MKKNTCMAILQPEVPHYREEFYGLLKEHVQQIDLFVYNSIKEVNKRGFCQNERLVKHIPNFKIKGIVFYNPFVLLNKKYDTLVLMLHFAHFTTWLLLITKFIHRKRIIVWGQGISIKRYIREEKKPHLLLKWMMTMADAAWLYMPKEVALWKQIFPKKPIIALGNTIAGVKDIVNYQSLLSKAELKAKYGIREQRLFIYCARFNTHLRRTDLLEQTIQGVDNQKIGFIIIGDGPMKPDFTKYVNVYEFGAVYDINVKHDLFWMADAYYQPAWMGLSIVEAMAYGKPICTFIRTEETKQGVEYDYISPNETGLLFSSVEEAITRLSEISEDRIIRMGQRARERIRTTATSENMVGNAISVL